jgi:diguanylate cyclase (GGDEF)-like protein/PAS domain S-box-containing protein
MGSFIRKQKRFSDQIKSTRHPGLIRPDDGMMYKRLVEEVRSGVFMADAHGFFFYVNHALADMLGYQTTDEAINKNFFEILFDSKETGQAFLDRMEQMGFIRDYELEWRRKDGEVLSLSITSNYIRYNGGKIMGIEGIIQDKTQEARMKQAVLLEKRKLEQILSFGEVISSLRKIEELADYTVTNTAMILEAGKCSLMMYDKASNCLYIEKAVGLEPAVVAETKVPLGEPIAGVVAVERQPILVENIEYHQRFQRSNRLSYVSRSFMSAPVTLGDELIGVMNVADKKSSAYAGDRFNAVDLRILCAIVREVASAFENVRVINELNLLTVTDPLTEIYNYRQFAHSLDQEIKRFKRSSGTLCIIMMDLDNFKSYNDTYGHVEGDALLRGIGEILHRSLRDSDIVCRYAGDEFVMVLPDTDIQGVRESAAKIVQAVEGYPFKRKVTVSLGAAKFQPGMSQKEFIVKADQALYQAKQSGKNRFCIIE